MRRLLALSVAAVGALTLAGAGLPAGAQPAPVGVAPLTIEKEVDGPVPEDAEFTVTVTCNAPAIFTGLTTDPVSSAKVDFDDEGDPDGSNVITFADSATCTVKETEDGDAEDVTYECEGQIPFDGTPCLSSGPQEDPIKVVIQSESQSATVTVENEFPDPEPPAPVPAAQPVAVAPTFTG